MSAVSQKAVEAIRTSLEGIAMLSEPEARQALEAALPHLAPTEAIAPVQPEPDAGLNDLYALANELSWNKKTRHISDRINEALRRTKPSTAQPSQGEAVAWFTVPLEPTEEMLKQGSLNASNGQQYVGEYRTKQAWLAMIKAAPPAPVDVGAAVAAERARAQIELWFFRDMSDEQRLKLFSLAGMPVDEIGKTHGHQRLALRHMLRAIRQSTLGEPKEGGENG